MIWAFMQMVFSLVVVLGLMFGMLVIFKKYLPTQNQLSNSTVSIDVLGFKTMQPKRAIIVVGIMEKILVLSSSESGITMLSEFSSKETAKLRKHLNKNAMIEKPLSVQTTFSEQLAKKMNSLLNTKEKKLKDV